MASQARWDQKASRCPAAHRVGVPAEAQTFNAENAASRAPRAGGRSGPPGAPLPPGPPSPALPRSPEGRSLASPRPRRRPPEPSSGRAGAQPGRGRAGWHNRLGPQTHHGRRAASAPTARSHKAPATPVVLVTPAGRPAPFPRWARRRPLAAFEHVMCRAVPFGPPPAPPLRPVHLLLGGASSPFTLCIWTIITLITLTSLT